MRTLNQTLERLKGTPHTNNPVNNNPPSNSISGGNTNPGTSISNNSQTTTNNNTVVNNTSAGSNQQVAGQPNTGNPQSGGQSTSMSTNNQMKTGTNTGMTTGTNTGMNTGMNTQSNPQTNPTPQFNSQPTPQTSQGSSSGGTILVKAKEVVPFMIANENNVLEFWNIWFESIPKTGAQYMLVISCDGGELSWRSSGPQNVFIQKMVDFFWNVGAPESEIDRLNDFGALVNPISIGSWINMSKLGGMDGGWFFPVPLSLKIALETCDQDSENTGAGTDNQVVGAIQQWSSTNKIEESIYVGRDMGAAPPRQTEIRIKLNQSTVVEQLNVAISAFKAFRFPDIPQQVLNILRQFTNPGIILSIISSSEGFVKIGVLFPQPSWNVALQLIEEGRKFGNNIAAGVDLFSKLNGVFQMTVPDFIEFQYLAPGFGYNVYKEEFNVFVHYKGN
jgi:hypothetical protein